MTFLLSWQASVLSRNRASGALMQSSLADPFDEAEPINVVVAADHLQTSFDHYLRNDAGMPPVAIPRGPLAGWLLQRAGDGRSVSVSRGGQFLCATQDSHGIAARNQAKAWEWFLPVSDADFAALRQIVRRDWIIRSSGEFVPSASVRFGEHWSLQLGSLWLDLRFQLPFDLTRWPHRLTVLREGWRIEEICQYRPLVYHTAFGPPAIMGQFALSVRSLRATGGYGGAIAVMSEHGADHIASLLGEPAASDGGRATDEPMEGWPAPPQGGTRPAPQGGARAAPPAVPWHAVAGGPTDLVMAAQPGDATDTRPPASATGSAADNGTATDHTGARCAVLWRDARDRTAFMSARYTIADWAAAWAYQPILYVDTDIVFESEIEPMLRAIATSDRLAAPFEANGPLHSTASVGAGLLQLDGFDPRDRLGFNSGTIGIPNLAEHAGTLRLICRVLSNHAQQRGRVTLTHGDQEVANYVGCRTGTFDTTLLAPFVRIGGDPPLSLKDRRTVAHFWASPGAEARMEAMRRHMQRLGIAV